MGSRNSESSDLSEVTKSLSNNGAIRIWHCPMNARFVNLNTHDIFRALVSLYENYFQSRLRSFKYLVNSHTLPPPFTSSQSYIATVYISHWFIDLYVSIREAIDKQPYLSISEPFFHYEYHHSRKYDYFLAELNAHLRPTHIKLTPEDSLYVPVISNEPDFNKKENPFGIDGFKLDCIFFEDLVWTLEGQKVCKMVELSDEIMGKPSWLLDWHQSGAFTWFPQQGNYSLEDITVAYVLGVACTPNLGIKDVDEWQYLPDQKISETSVDPNMYNRVTSQAQYGSREAHSVEVEEWSGTHGVYQMTMNVKLLRMMLQFPSMFHYIDLVLSLKSFTICLRLLLLALWRLLLRSKVLQSARVRHNNFNCCQGLFSFYVKGHEL